MATAQKVKTMIIQREMKPGDRLPTEKELAESFWRKPVYTSGSHEVPESRRNVVVIQQGSGTFVSAGAGIGEAPWAAFHQSGEADPESVQRRVC